MTFSADFYHSSLYPSRPDSNQKYFRTLFDFPRFQFNDVNPWSLLTNWFTFIDNKTPKLLPNPRRDWKFSRIPLQHPTIMKIKRINLWQLINKSTIFVSKRQRKKLDGIKFIVGSKEIYARVYLSLTNENYSTSSGLLSDNLYPKQLIKSLIIVFQHHFSSWWVFIMRW